MNNDDYLIDMLAADAGGYCAAPSDSDIEYTNLFFDICKQFGIRYCSASPKERYFVDEVTRLTWARLNGEYENIRLSFTA